MTDYVNSVQNNFKLTNQYLNQLASKECDFSSIAAKVGFVALPLIMLVTVLIDLFSASPSEKLLKNVSAILSDNSMSPPKQMGKLFDLFQDVTIRDFINGMLNASVENMGELMIAGQNFAMRSSLNPEECQRALVSRVFQQYPTLARFIPPEFAAQLAIRG